MQAQVVNDKLDAVSQLEIDDNIFAIPFNEGLVHQVVTAYMAGARAGSKAQKTRAEVSGGGKKPWRQKGTGRARAGTIRSPLWRGGGRTFAAQPRNYSQKVNRKMYRAAMRSLLAELLRQQRLTIVDELKVAQAKTRELLAKLTAMKITGRVLMVVDAAVDDNLVLASRNLPHVDVCFHGHLNPAAMLAFDQIIITQSALQAVEQQLR